MAQPVGHFLTLKSEETGDEQNVNVDQVVRYARMTPSDPYYCVVSMADGDKLHLNQVSYEKLHNYINGV